MEKLSFLRDERLSSSDKLLMVYISDTGISDLEELVRYACSQQGIDEDLIRKSYKKLKALNYLS